MDLIGIIIREEVDRMLSEASHIKPKFDRRHGYKKYTEEQKHHVQIIFRKLKEKYPNAPIKELVRKAEKMYDEIEKKRMSKYRTRKKKGGGKERYSYNEYESKNIKSSAANAEQIRMRIDQENTDIAAVARKVFPKHTDEGAQSQLRKILNGDRPMTKRVASILSDMISSGQIAVKKD
jgi:DNA-binding transcriptional MerR regulator